MKVKVFREKYEEDLEIQINEFISNIAVVDIKFSTFVGELHYYYLALVMYKENEEKK